MAGTEDRNSESKCPVDHSTFKHFLPRDATPQSTLPEGHPAVSTTSPNGEPAKCPVSPEAHKHFMPRSAQSSSGSSPISSASNSIPKDTATTTPMLMIDPKNNMPSKPDQFRAASQRVDLNTEREYSSIPKAATSPDPYGDNKNKDAGAHSADPDNDKENVWIYPSEQMFFNAMKRKNWSPREEDMKFVVPIHNMVNEMAWKHILRWEKLMEK
ncbi:Cytochrome c1 heme lyase [Lobosporangium transversale]|nr:Cytochrome c1 heme lyase [Lobosporangium transversale]